MTQVNRMLSDQQLRRPGDEVLRLHRAGPRWPAGAWAAAGRRASVRENARKIFKRDVSRYVGSEHDLMRYVCARAMPA